MSLTAHEPSQDCEPPTDSQDRVLSINTAVVIPAYRASAHIADVLRGIPPFIRSIVVVDDQSPDNTAEIVLELSDPRVHLVRHESNQGVGGAMLTGYDVAIALGADIVVKMDSDDQMDPDYLLDIIAPIMRGHADYTKGNRFIHLAELQQMPLRRRFGNAGLAFLTKFASGYWNIFDPTNGYTAIASSVIPLIDRSRIGRRYFFESSMLIELSLSRAVVADVPIPARYGTEQSSLSELSSLIQFPPKILRGFLLRILIQYFLRDFSAGSAFMVAGVICTTFGALWGGYHWLTSALHDTPTTTGTVMIAVLPVILGLQLLLQAIIADIQSVPSIPVQRLARPRLSDMAAASPRERAPIQ